MEFSGTGRKKIRLSGKAVLAIVIAAAFIISLAVYFANSYITTERENVVYSSLDEPELPVVYAVVTNGDGVSYDINPMRGHYQDMGSQDAEFVTPLPA